MQAEHWITDDWRRELSECDIAISSDGSYHARCKTTWFRHFVFPSRTETKRILTRQPERQQFIVDDATRTAVGTRSFEWIASPDADPDCSRKARMAISMDGSWTPPIKPTVKSVGKGRVAGYDVVRYLVSIPMGNEPFDLEISMAPSLSCEVMEAVHTTPGWLGVTKGKVHYRVTHHEAGEPDPALMRIPAGYRVKPY